MTFQEAIALQKATGNQNVITPENYGRIMGLAAQAEAGKQLAMDRGAQAVEERKRLQALQGDGSLSSQGRLLETYDPEKGRQRFVFDKQGNVIGSATLDKPAAPVAGIDRELMNANRGLATDQEKQLLRQAMRDQMLAAVQGDKGMKAYDEVQAAKAKQLEDLRKGEAAASQAQAEATGLKALTGGFSPIPFRQPQQGGDFLSYIMGQARAIPEATPPSSAEQKVPLEKEMADLENEFSVQGLATPEQKEMGKQQADLYRRRNDLLKWLQSGQISTPYYDAETGAGETSTPLSAADKSKYIKELRDLEKKIPELQKKISGSQAKSATPSKELSRYMAIQAALDKLNQ